MHCYNKCNDKCNDKCNNKCSNKCNNKCNDKCNNKCNDKCNNYTIKYVPNKDYQIECLKDHCCNLIKENNMNLERYKQLLKEIDNMYDILENNVNKNCCDNKTVESSTGTCANTIIFKYLENVQTYSFDNTINFVYVTAVGGGGAGGVGFIKDMYYYSGGGGGAGSCIIKKPIKILPGTIVNVKVGKGADALTSTHRGENTIIEFIYVNGSIKKLVLKGGWSGHPYFSEIGLVSGISSVQPGEGGIDDCGLTFLSGGTGCPGAITIPSQLAACGGKGGSSMMNNGGKGGGNYFSNGGDGGKNNTTNLLGENGEFGSGGGGSIPKFIHTDPLSGLGGDGIVIIEW